jgi:hypothetical protein
MLAALSGESAPIDFLLVDRLLWQRDNLEIRKRLGPHSRFAILAPLGMGADSATYFQTGFAGWITKPVRPSQAGKVLTTGAHLPIDEIALQHAPVVLTAPEI